MNERALREQVAEASRALHARGWVGNHDGNVSARAGAGRFVITPTATSKARVTNDSLVVVDESGAKIGGAGAHGAKPPGEVGLHATVYAKRGDVAAVVHAHPPHATALACAGSKLLERAFIAEAVVSLGPSVPTVPFAPPGREACAALAAYVDAYDAVLVANHGVMAWGVDVEQAMLRMELVEHLARIATLAERVGGVKPLPESAIPALLEARQKAGLGPQARGGSAKAEPGGALSPRPVVACAPSPDANVPIVAPGRAAGGAPAADVATIIREELARALRER